MFPVKPPPHSYPLNEGGSSQATGPLISAPKSPHYLSQQRAAERVALKSPPRKSRSYLQLVEGEAAQAVIHLGVVQGLPGTLQPCWAEGQSPQVAVFSHLIHVQREVHSSQAVKSHQLLLLISWELQELRGSPVVSTGHCSLIRPRRLSESIRCHR